MNEYGFAKGRYGFGFDIGLSSGLGFAGSAVLAQILYTTDLNTFEYAKDGSGNMIVDNKGTTGDTHDLKLYSGQALEVGATQVFNIPLEYTLGAEMVTNGDMSSATGWVLGGPNWTISGGVATKVAGDAVNLAQLITLTTGITYKVTYTITRTAGTIKIGLGNNYSATVSASGTYTYYLQKTTLDDLYIVPDATFAGTVDNVSLMPLTYTTEAVALYKLGTWEYKTIADFTSNTYLITTGTYGHIAVLATEPSTADKAYLESNINAIADLWFDNPTVLTSIVKADIQHLYIPEVRQNKVLFDITSALGAEKISNSTFDSSITPWSTYGSSLSWDASQRLKFTAPSGGGTCNAWIDTGAVLSTTSYYLCTWEYNQGTSSSTLGNFGATAGGTVIASGSGWIVYKFNGTSARWIAYTTSMADGTVSYLDNVSIKEITHTITIPNYASTMYTNADFNQKTQQSTPIIFNGTGRATDVDYTALNWYGNGYGDTQRNLSLEASFWIEEIVGGVIYQHKYDGTNLTTYTNNVSGTPTAHTPENATYKLGKGVYPKVTANPYTTAVHKYFSVEIDNYATYNQSARYTTLQGVL